MKNPSQSLKRGVMLLIWNREINKQEMDDALEYLEALEANYQDVLKADSDLNLIKEENLAF